MALKKTLTNHSTFVESNYWVLSEYSHFIHADQIRLVLNGYVSKAIYEKHGKSAAADTRVYLLDTKKQYLQREILEMRHFDEVWEEGDDGVRIKVADAYDAQVGTGKFEKVWVNEKDYVDADALIQQVVPFIYTSLSKKGDFLGAEVDLSSLSNENEKSD